MLTATRAPVVAYGPYAEKIRARTPELLEPLPAFVAPQRRAHQVRALDAITKTIRHGGRAQIHWACGTGKTLVSRWLAEDLEVRTALVLVPSLALVAQALAEWQTASDWPFQAIVVCSDRSTGDAWRVDPGWWTQHGVRVTTDAAVVSGFMSGRSSLPRIVFSTYHSAPVVAEAINRARGEFDLMVCDEAHRLAGSADERFRIALDDGELPSRRRLFTTATPVFANGRPGSAALSMSDTSVFGPVVDRLDFAEAIEAGLLVDYQVLVLDATGDIGDLDAGTAVPAVLAAASREGLTRVISFHSRVARARRFAGDVDGLQLPDGRTVSAQAIAGADPTAVRRAALARLGEGSPKALTLVSNARCLTEGVNVPAVDGVVFADPKTSDTDIVQAIGRALRPAPGKTRGLIILPVVVPPGADNDELFAGPFAAVWGVLRTLRSLDPRMAAALESARNWRGDVPKPTGGYHQAVLRFDVTGMDLGSLVARVLDDTGPDDAFVDMLDQLRDWIGVHGHSALPWAATSAGRPLGRWVGTQRRAYAVDALPPDRVHQLESLPGWAWTLDGAWWSADRAAVARFAVDHLGLDLNNPDVAGARFTHRTAQSQKSGLTVGRWCAQQRRAARDGDLSGWQIDECETIRGWSWDAGVPVRDLKMVDALAEWVDRHGDANVPHAAVWGVAPLGSFITAVRRRAITGRLQLPLAEDIAAVTPNPPSDGALEWRPAETRWELHLLALAQFAARTGGCQIPEHGTEELNGFTYSLYAWATRQRHLHRHGNLDPDRAEMLERVPGWQWERIREARVIVGIGARQHGTRAGYAAGCLCELCTAANTAAEAERQRRRANGEATTDLIDATAARGHLRVIEGQVGRRARTAMQQVVGVNKKTIDEIINGDRKRVHPEVDAALRALTAAILFEHIEANPSTRDDLPAAPTMALIDDLLSRGWPKAWISRELNGGPALQIGRTPSGPVRRETADAIAALHAAIGERRPPQRQHRTSLPRLADILVNEHGLVAV